MTADYTLTEINPAAEPSVPSADNADQVVVQVSAGTLLVFPAWLQHSVDANRSGEERISVSFNVMLASYAEQMSKPLWEPDQA